MSPADHAMLLGGQFSNCAVVWPRTEGWAVLTPIFGVNTAQICHRADVGAFELVRLCRNVPKARPDSVGCHGSRSRRSLPGRPYIWGLALGGQTGVETVLRMLLADLDLTMALSGYTRPSELSRDALVRPDPSPLG